MVGRENDVYRVNRAPVRVWVHETAPQKTSDKRIGAWVFLHHNPSIGSPQDAFRVWWVAVTIPAQTGRR